MDFINSYLKEVSQITEKLRQDSIQQLIDELARLRDRKGRLFIIGVGGSAANASHACNDFRKLALIEAYAVTDNISELTARTNDEGWENTFRSWLKCSGMNQSDALLVFSVGGGDVERNISLNICRAVDLAKETGTSVLSIVGRELGYVQDKSEICVVIPPINPLMITPHSESFQAVIWHLIVSHPRIKREQTTW
jgi:D-sedoheptulose 7-phosphate isomerase